MDLFCYLVVFRDCLCYTVLSVPCSLEVSCCQKPNLLALLCVTFSSFFSTFQYGVPGQVQYICIVRPVKRDWAVLSKDTPVDISI